MEREDFLPWNMAKWTDVSGSGSFLDLTVRDFLVSTVDVESSKVSGAISINCSNCFSDIVLQRITLVNSQGVPEEILYIPN